MERNSIKVVSYDNSKSKSSCVSSDGVDFRVSIYRGKGKFLHVIIVDIQHCEEFPPSYYFDVIGIFDAAEGNITHAMPMLNLLKETTNKCSSKHIEQEKHIY